MLQPITPDYSQQVKELRDREPERVYLLEYKGHQVTDIKTAWAYAKEKAGITGGFGFMT
jgi:hypothetical protein